MGCGCGCGGFMLVNFLSECLQVGKWVGMAGRWVWGRLYGARGRARCGWVGGGGWVGVGVVVSCSLFFVGMLACRQMGRDGR